MRRPVKIVKLMKCKKKNRFLVSWGARRRRQQNIFFYSLLIFPFLFLPRVYFADRCCCFSHDNIELLLCATVLSDEKICDMLVHDCRPRESHHCFVSISRLVWSLGVIDQLYGPWTSNETSKFNWKPFNF